MERRKHDQASVAINKVADDLSAQGIETRAYKSCQRAQVKFGKGFLTCSTGIIYDGNDSVLSVKEPLEKFISFIENWDFRPSGTADELNPTRHPIVVGTLNYVLYESPLRCGLSYDKVDDSSAPYTLSFGCSKYSKFAIF